MYPDDECPDQILKYPQRRAGNQSLRLVYCEILSCSSVTMWCWIWVELLPVLIWMFYHVLFLHISVPPVWVPVHAFLFVFAIMVLNLCSVTSTSSVWQTWFPPLILGDFWVLFAGFCEEFIQGKINLNHKSWLNPAVPFLMCYKNEPLLLAQLLFHHTYQAWLIAVVLFIKVLFEHIYWF